MSTNLLADILCGMVQTLFIMLVVVFYGGYLNYQTSQCIRTITTMSDWLSVGCYIHIFPPNTNTQAHTRRATQELGAVDIVVRVKGLIIYTTILGKCQQNLLVYILCGIVQTLFIMLVVVFLGGYLNSVSPNCNALEQ